MEEAIYDRPSHPTAKTYAQNALFFALFSLFVALAMTAAWFGCGDRREALASLPKPEARVWVGQIYFWAWLSSTCVSTSCRFVRIYMHGKRSEVLVLREQDAAGRDG